jgi:hypothetical protein
MAPTTDDPVLFPDHAGFPDGVVVINDRCRLQQRGSYRVVIKNPRPQGGVSNALTFFVAR